MIESLPPPLGESPAFLELLEKISRVAPLDRPVLVVGERGTGKELIAARTHFLSRRWDGPFVKLNCAALTETLIEAELFGHEAGAFTGAARRRIGRFELADGGTLFLDEIANASLSVQEKVLRVIEYGEMERLGGNETLTVDVRIVAATNEDLPTAADAGRFRYDLLDRLAFDVLTVPPLRFRHGDVAILADHYGRAMARDLDWAAFPGFTGEAAKALDAYPWPGNVRELRNVVERAVAHAPSQDEPIAEIRFDPFESPYRPQSGPTGESDTATPPSQPQRQTSSPCDLKAEMAQFEREILEAALAANRHNQRATASHLSLSYDQLRTALKRHGLIGQTHANPNKPLVAPAPEPGPTANAETASKMAPGSSPG